jgi:hypothetical protein
VLRSICRNILPPSHYDWDLPTAAAGWRTFIPARGALHSKSLHQYYQEHRDDPEVWGELDEAPEDAPMAQSRGTGLSITVSVRLAPAEADALRQTARREGKTYSEVVRAAIRRYAQPDRIPMTGDAITLASLNEHAPQTQPDTTAPALRLAVGRIDSQTRSSTTLGSEH